MALSGLFRTPYYRRKTRSVCRTERRLYREQWRTHSRAQQPNIVSWVASNTRRTSICNVCANCDCFAKWNVSLTRFRMFNHFKTQINLHYVRIFSLYCLKNTACFCYEEQSINIVQENNSCLVCDLSRRGTCAYLWPLQESCNKAFSKY